MKSLRYPAALSASLTPLQDRLLFLTGGSRWPGTAPHLRGLFPHVSVFLQAAARFLARLTCGCAAVVSSIFFHSLVMFMGVDEWFSTMDRVSDKCSAVIGCLDPPPHL